MKTLGIMIYISVTAWALTILLPLYALAFQGFEQIGGMLP